VVAFCASLPGLSLPFMSDDWVNLASVSKVVALRTSFGYFRPLYLASFWAELRLWGLSPAVFHLTNTFLIAACAALIVVVVRRFTRDSLWATAAGVLFALHPYHVENAAWIAARGDPAATALALIALLSYERWARQGRGLPWGAIAAFEAALLCKESVAFFPAIVLVLRVLETRTTPSRPEWLKGILPLGGTVLLNFFVLRQSFLGDSGIAPVKAAGIPWVKRGVDYFSAAVVPVHAERIETHPILWAAAAMLVLAVLAMLARRSLKGHAFEAGSVALLFCAALAPSLVSFQERHMLFPSVVSCVGLAYLMLRAPRRLIALAWVFVLVIWMGSLGEHWHGWLQAGKASARLVSDLTEASHDDNVREIVIANQPYRVGGAPVAGALSTAVRLSGGRDVRILAATSLNLPGARDSGIDGAWDDAVRIGPAGAELRVRQARGVFSGIFLPLVRPPTTTSDQGYATLEFEVDGGVNIKIPRSAQGDRIAYAWYDGELKRLF
jgi:hypothetical protein